MIQFSVPTPYHIAGATQVYAKVLKSGQLHRTANYSPD
jgi:hypothetical protein